MQTALLHPDSKRWVALLNSTRHDFYHLPSYLKLAAQETGDEAVAFYASKGDSKFLLPLLLRKVSGTESGVLDAASPYGYPGPLWSLGSNENADEFGHQVIGALHDQLRSSNVVSLFVRFHPILNEMTDLFSQHGVLQHHGPTVSCDLSSDETEMWRQTRRDHRRNINRSKREGHSVAMDEKWAHIEQFLEIYRSTMARVGASPDYYFSKKYFLDLRAALGDKLQLCIVKIGDEVAAAGLFSEIDGIVQFHLSGTHSDFLNHRPSKLMLDFVRRWAAERKNRHFHLGGGLGAKEDSLFEFKAGFSENRHMFSTFRSVVNEPVYQDLCLSRGLDPRTDSDYFPPYARP